MTRAALLLVLIAMSVAVISGCRRRGGAPDYERTLRPGEIALQAVPAAEWPTFRLDGAKRGDLRSAIDHSLSYLASPSAGKKYPIAGVQQAQVVQALERLAQLLDQGVDERQLNATLRQEMTLLRSVGWDGQGVVLFTGYYTPIFRGSRTPGGEFRYPLYRRPADLVSQPGGRGVATQQLADGSSRPYPDRAELERSGVLAGSELVWLPSAMDAYIIQVQGSAKLRLADGGMMEIGWAGDTGHDYVPIRDALVRDRQIPIEQFNLSTLRAWADRNPQLVERYIQTNPRYVFFTEAPGGPFGSLGRKVTADVSIATDKRIFPPGALTYVETQVGPGTGQAYAAFRLDQDTGGAIRAPGRCDLYMGEGPAAEQQAGYQYHEGSLYYLVAR